jgi:hypothetical protein
MASIEATGNGDSKKQIIILPCLMCNTQECIQVTRLKWKLSFDGVRVNLPSACNCCLYQGVRTILVKVGVKVPEEMMNAS